MGIGIKVWCFCRRDMVGSGVLGISEHKKDHPPARPLEAWQKVDRVKYRIAPPAGNG